MYKDTVSWVGVHQAPDKDVGRSFIHAVPFSSSIMCESGYMDQVGSSSPQ